MYNFELICQDLAMSDQAQLVCDSQKNQLYSLTDSWDIGLSGIIQNLIGREDFGR